ncbi:MAG: hypothetical protein ACRCXD_17510 [Luteolibacter sp.]
MHFSTSSTSRRRWIELALDSPTTPSYGGDADPGGIDIDHSMVGYLPGQPSDWPAAWQEITVRQLLLHTSTTKVASTDSRHHCSAG